MLTRHLKHNVQAVNTITATLHAPLLVLCAQLTLNTPLPGPAVTQQGVGLNPAQVFHCQVMVTVPLEQGDGWCVMCEKTALIIDLSQCALSSFGSVMADNHEPSM